MEGIKKKIGRETRHRKREGKRGKISRGKKGKGKERKEGRK